MSAGTTWRLIVAGSDPETAALIEGAGIESFEALRGLLRRQEDIFRLDKISRWSIYALGFPGVGVRGCLGRQRRGTAGRPAGPPA
jgi:hypothetical protein